jgi:hypothetical protein
MSVHRLLLVACLALCIAVTPGPSVSEAEEASTEASVEGVLVANGETVELPYVYIYAKEEGFYDEADPTWELIFVEHPIEERKVDEHIWDAAYISLGVTLTAEFGDAPELQVYSQDIRFSADAAGNVSGGDYPQIELTEAGPERFAGRVYHTEPQEIFDDVFQYDFTFSAPLSDPNAPIGDPLPAGGGEPGAAYLAWVEAIHAGDIERLKTLVPAEQAEALDAEGIEEELEFMKEMTPTNVEILGGSSDGENAILQVAGTMDGETIAAEVTLIHQEGHWIATNVAIQ